MEKINNVNILKLSKEERKCFNQAIDLLQTIQSTLNINKDDKVVINDKENLILNDLNQPLKMLANAETITFDKNARKYFLCSIKIGKYKKTEPIKASSVEEARKYAEKLAEEIVYEHSREFVDSKYLSKSLAAEVGWYNSPKECPGFVSNVVFHSAKINILEIYTTEEEWEKLDI